MKSNRYARSLLSLIIASVMIVTMLPVSALAADADVMIEDQAETIVEAAEDVGGELVEDVSSEVVEETAEVPDIEESTDAAIVTESDDGVSEADSEELTGTTEILSVRADGTLSGSKMYYDAQLTGLSVSAVVPAKRTAEGSYMTADIVDVSAYEDTVAKKNRGKYLSDLYGLELHFYDKKGKEITHINTSDITVTVNAYPAQSYYIGRIDKKLKTIQRGTEATFTFQEKKAYTYVIAGLMDDGLNRVSAETDGEGNKRFNLNDENVSVEVIAPEDAFADDVSMEASDAINGPAQATEDDDEVLVGASSDEYVAAVEISFYNEDGDEQQPKKDVTVRIAASLDMSKSYKLIHIADNGEKSEVENAVFTEDGVEFTADSFSVYAIVSDTPNDPKPYRATYKFFNADGTAFVFKNKIGEVVDNQILKDGEVLEDVGLPAGSSANSKFLGWYDGDGNLVPTGEAKTVTANKTINLTAKFETVYNIVFMTAADNGGARSVEAVKQVSYTTGQSSAITVALNDVKTEAPDNTKAFIGWNTNDNATTALESPATVTGDTVFYPVFENASWLFFDENDGGHGGGASYTPPQFVLVGGVTTRPDDPIRTNYEFKGWYNEPACTTEFTFGQSLTANKTVYAKWEAEEQDYTIIIYKQRVTDSVDASDDEKTYDYEASIPMRGDFGAAVTVPSQYTGYDNQESVFINGNEHNFVGFHYNGTKTAADNAGKTIADDGSTVVAIYYDRNVISISFDYPASSSSSQTVTVYVPAENGQYYFYNDPYDTGYYAGGTGPTPNATLTHHLVGFIWSSVYIPIIGRHTHYYYTSQTGYYKKGEGPDPNNPGPYYNKVTTSASATEYPADTTWTGLFGATFADTGHRWPSTYEVKYHTGADVTTNTVNTLWEEKVADNQQATVLVFLDAFILPDPTLTEYNLRPHGTGNIPIRFFQQKTNGDYPTAAAEASYSVTSSGGNFLITDKYTGFKAHQYRTYRNGSWSNWTTLRDTPDNEGVYATVQQGYSALEIRFERNTYDLEFKNGEKGAQGTTVKTQQIKYQAELASAAVPPTVTYPVAATADHYEFTGWYTDPDFTTYVSFTELSEEQKEAIRYNTGATSVVSYLTMPANNLVLYAGWTLKGFDCALNPNGGTLRESPTFQAGVFWVQYSKKIADSIKYDTTREGYDLVGWMVSTVDGELINVERDPDRGNLRFVGDFSNWTMTDTPWNFDAGITGPVYLTAKWRSTTALRVIYDAKAGSGEPSDSNNYMDGSKCVALGSPTTLPENKLFKGWHIVGTPDGEIYKPGYTFTIDSQYAVEGVITLEAVYTDVNNQEVNVTHITWYGNGGVAADGTTEYYTDEGVQINQTINIKAADTFTREGYTFLGWARVPTTDAEGTPLPDYSLNPVELSESDLFLKYNKDEDIFEVKVNGTWTKADAVGADEIYPYHDLYAVWEAVPYYYIFHSSTGNLEAIEWTENASINLNDKVPSHHYYGGYYSAYGGYAVTADDMKAAREAASKITKVTDNTYDGTSLNINGKRYWTKSNAGTTSGTPLTPTAEAVYYLKEVPNCYLGTNAKWVYDSRENYNYCIKAIYLLTGIDDTNYTEAGFVITEVNKKGQVVSKFTYQKETDTAATTITAATLIGQRGYLAVVNANTCIKTLSNGTSVVIQPYWKTLDGVTVSTSGYTFSNSEGKATLTKDNISYTQNT